MILNLSKVLKKMKNKLRERRNQRLLMLIKLRDNALNVDMNKLFSSLYKLDQQMNQVHSSTGVAIAIITGVTINSGKSRTITNG